MSNNETTQPAQPNSKIVNAAFVKALAAIESGQLSGDPKMLARILELNRIAGALRGIEEAQEALSQGRSIPQQLELFEGAQINGEPRAVLPESRL